MDEASLSAEEDDFWSVLEKRICEQIKEIDSRIDSLYNERDRLHAFIRDHGRRCA